MITGITLVGMLHLFVMSSNYLKVASHRMRAIGLAQGRLDELRAQGYNNVTAAGDSGTINVVIDEGKTSATGDDVVGTMTTQVIELTDNKKAIVSVDWVDIYTSMNETLEVVFYNID